MSKAPVRIPPGMKGVIATGLLLAMLQAQADTTINVHVKVVTPPPCVINGGRAIEVNFGNEVMTTRVDGINYSQAVNYGVTCTGQTKNAMSLKIEGSAAAFDSSALTTSKSNLGIQLQGGGKAWPLNSGLKFTYPSLPVIKAVPVMNAANKLTAGAFSASATMKVDYQ